MYTKFAEAHGLFTLHGTGTSTRNGIGTIGEQWVLVAVPASDPWEYLLHGIILTISSMYGNNLVLCRVKIPPDRNALQ